jgi:hypothetical protein
MELDLEKQKKEEEEKKKKMTRIAKVKYMEEKEALQKKSQTSFGKLILADEKTNPMYSKLLINFYFRFWAGFKKYKFSGKCKWT